jgi:hypothetical protein
MKFIISLGSILNCLIFIIVRPEKSKKEIAIPNPTSIIVCGILVLDEITAAANIIAKNIGITYWEVRNICPPSSLPP